MAKTSIGTQAGIGSVVCTPIRLSPERDREQRDSQDDVKVDIRRFTTPNKTCPRIYFGRRAGEAKYKPLVGDR
jgi:hypothetical protein